MEVKRFLLLFLLIGLLSCSKDGDDADLIGEWKLVEAYVDPGDGSGGFQPVESKKVVKFYANGEIWSNGSLCMVFDDTTGPSRGTYSFADSTITVKKCGDYKPRVNPYFRIEGKYLIIHYFCMEGCGEKYVKK
jgi:hypothetical protein